MAVCTTCGGSFQWGRSDDRWILLEPIETHDDLDRSYVDENGELRADHRDRHPGGASVNVERLDRKIKAEDAPRAPAVERARRRFAGAKKAVVG